MDEKILTIKKVNFTGKWVELWFHEDHETIVPEADSYHLSSKAYRLWEAVERAGIDNEISNKGFEGLKVRWKLIGPNWEIDEVGPGVVNKEFHLSEKEWQNIRKFVENFGYPGSYGNRFELRLTPGSLAWHVEIAKMGDDEVTSGYTDVTDYDNM